MTSPCDPISQGKPFLPSSRCLKVGPDVAQALKWILGHVACGHPGNRKQNLPRQRVHAVWAPIYCWCLMGSGASAPLSTWGIAYLVPFVAPPSAHPVGPHSREEGQVVAIGLRQEHRLPGVQSEAGAGVSLLRNRGATRRVEKAPNQAAFFPGRLRSPPPVGLASHSQTLAYRWYECPIAALTKGHKLRGF